MAQVASLLAIGQTTLTAALIAACVAFQTGTTRASNLPTLARRLRMCAQPADRVRCEQKP